MKFKCLHSGKCCETPLSQINLTLGDIKRIKQYTKKPIKELLKKHIGMNPFKDPKKDKFDIEIGLNIPCQFRKNNRCEIYQARPLNCRLFPFWILADIPDNKIKEVIPKEYECIHRLKLTKALREKFKNYSKKLGEILLKEAKLTDDFLIKNNLKFSVEVKNPDENDIEYIKSLTRQIDNNKLANKIEKELKQEFKTNKEINEFEELL